MNTRGTIINSVRLDIVYSLVLSGIVSVILYYIDFNPITNDVISTFVTFFGILLGFTITAITMLFMFDPTDYEILSKIKEQGLYGQIFDRYLSSIKVLLVSSVSLIIMMIFLNIVTLKYTYLIPYLIFVFLLVVFLSFLRIYRCISLLADICNILGQP